METLEQVQRSLQREVLGQKKPRLEPGRIFTLIRGKDGTVSVLPVYHDEGERKARKPLSLYGSVFKPVMPKRRGPRH